MPIVLTLDTWAQHKGNLEEWFAREASRVYGIGIDLARTWVEHDALIPLLDGLDEIADEKRNECVLAINAFHEKRGTLPIAVCSRTAEYDRLKERLALTSAVVIEPLTGAQIGMFLKEGGTALAGLAQAWQTMRELRELLTTPLMLSVAAAAFADRAQQPLLMASAGDVQQQLWSAYVRRMLERRRQGRQRAAHDERTLRYLAWLARAMRERSLSVFYIDQLQPDWLPDYAQRTYQLLGGLAGGMAVWLVFGLPATLLIGQALGLPEGVACGLITGLMLGLPSGLAFGLGGAFLKEGNAKTNTSKTPRLLWWRGLAGSLVVGLACGWAYGVQFGLTHGLAFGLAGGLMGGAIFGFSWKSDIHTDIRKETCWSREQSFAGGLLGGLAVRLALGLVDWLTNGRLD